MKFTHGREPADERATTTIGSIDFTPIAMCARGCGYHEQATMVVKYRTQLWGRVQRTKTSVFVSKNCPRCGSRLAQACTGCGARIAHASDSNCRQCGISFPWAADRALGRTRSLGRNWKQVALDFKVFEGSIWLISSDLTSLHVDSIVSSDDRSGRMVSDSANAIRRLAGQVVEDESVSKGPHKVGTAWSTEAGELLTLKRIIHVAATSRTGEAKQDDVAKCVASAFVEAVNLGLKSIALPIIGSGTGGLPLFDVSKLIIACCVEHLSTESSLKDLVIVVYNDEDLKLVETLIEEAIPAPLAEPTPDVP